jgi:hypothetical protein
MSKGAKLSLHNLNDMNQTQILFFPRLHYLVKSSSPHTKMVPGINPKIFKAQGQITTRLKVVPTIYSLKAQHVTCKN